MISTERVAVALGMIARMLDAGLSLQQTVQGEAIAELPAAVQKGLRRSIERGGLLSDAFEGVLDAAALGLLRAGERSGDLPRVLRRIQAGLEERLATRRRMLGMLAYPACVTAVAILVLPLRLLISSGLPAYLASVLPPTLVVAAIAVAWLVVLPRLAPDAPVRLLLRRIGLLLPVVGTVLWNEALATFADVLGSSIAAGLSAREALTLAAGATPHPRFAGAGQAMVARLDGGATLRSALEVVSPPARFLAQVSTGEQAGALDTTLARLAVDHREQAARALALGLKVFGGLVFAGAAIYAAAQIIGGYRETFEQRDREIERLLR